MKVTQPKRSSAESERHPPRWRRQVTRPMIKAIVFDLDGTLVQSEKLKAQSYAIAVQRLRGLREPTHRPSRPTAIIVGASPDVALRHITEKLELKRSKIRQKRNRYRIRRKPRATPSHRARPGRTPHPSFQGRPSRQPELRGSGLLFESSQL